MKDEGHLALPASALTGSAQLTISDILKGAKRGADLSDTVANRLPSTPAQTQAAAQSESPQQEYADMGHDDKDKLPVAGKPLDIVSARMKIKGGLRRSIDNLKTKVVTAVLDGRSSLAMPAMTDEPGKVASATQAQDGCLLL